MNSVTRNTPWWSNTEFEGKMAGWATISNSVMYIYKVYMITNFCVH